MLEVITVLSLISALVLLGALTITDLKSYLLPNELVLGFAAAGLVFHLSTVFAFLQIEDMAMGALLGGGILLAIRFVAGFFYGDDALGLGDVKLMAAAGLWLGPYNVLIALTLGAFLGMLHGLGIVLYYWFDAKAFIPLKTLSLPAGPGFIAGIVLTAAVQFWGLPGILWP